MNSILKQSDAKLGFQTIKDNGDFEGYASFFHVVDDHRDRVMPKAFETSLSIWKSKKKLPKMLWHHQQDCPIGVWHDIYEDEKGLYVKGKILLELQKGREIYALLKAKAIDGLSIGYHVLESSFDQDRSGRKIRNLHTIDLREISLVTFGANEHACVNNVKKASGMSDLLATLQSVSQSLN